MAPSTIDELYAEMQEAARTSPQIRRWLVYAWELGWLAGVHSATPGDNPEPTHNPFVLYQLVQELEL